LETACPQTVPIYQWSFNQSDQSNIQFEALDAQPWIIRGKLFQHDPGIVRAAVLGHHAFIPTRADRL
jgi:hypothetical protein